jgi:hypothetical protein
MMTIGLVVTIKGRCPEMSRGMTGLSLITPPLLDFHKYERESGISLVKVSRSIFPSDEKDLVRIEGFVVRAS